MLHGKQPDYNLFSVFGCLCYAHRRARDKDKFGERSRKCIFVGYPFGSKGWRLFDLERNEFFVSRDVTFLEEMFPDSDDSSYVSPPVHQTNIPVDDLVESIGESRGSNTSTHAPYQTPIALPSSLPSPPASPDDLNPPVSSSDIIASSSSAEPIPSSIEPSLPAVVSPEMTHDPPLPGLFEVLGRGQRSKKLSILLKNFVTNTAQDTHPLALLLPSILILR